MSSSNSESIRRAPLLVGDVGLSRFDPLGRIISYDDFDRGFCGWSQLVGNYEDSLDAMLPGYAQHSQPMLSTLPHWDAGSHGGMDGTYALKLATQPRAGSQNVALKRLTFRKAGPIRFEMYFTFKPEASELRLSESDVQSVGLVLDLQSGDLAMGEASQRVMPHLRFLNSENGVHTQRWQFKRRREPFVDIGSEGKTVSHYHLAPTGWEDIEGGGQRLCYNELPTKVNWHYLRFDFDLDSMKPSTLVCNDREFSMSGVEPMRIPAMKNLWCMLNVCVFVETAVDKRALLYVDSACLSGEF